MFLRKNREINMRCTSVLSKEFEFRNGIRIKRNTSLMTDRRVLGKGVGNRHHFAHIGSTNSGSRIYLMDLLCTPASLRLREIMRAAKNSIDTSRCCVYQHWKINGNPWRRCPASMTANECARLSPPPACENVAYSRADRRAHSAASCRTERTWISSSCQRDVIKETYISSEYTGWQERTCESATCMQFSSRR